MATKGLGHTKLADVELTEVKEEIATCEPVVGINVTDVAPVRLVPVIFTVVPSACMVDNVIEVGVKLDIVGRPFTNKPVEVPVPAALVTEIVAVVADVGMVALI